MTKIEIRTKFCTSTKSLIIQIVNVFIIVVTKTLIGVLKIQSFPIIFIVAILILILRIRIRSRRWVFKPKKGHIYYMRVRSAIFQWASREDFQSIEDTMYYYNVNCIFVHFLFVFYLFFQGQSICGQ